MTVVNFILAIIALVFALLAFNRAGGAKDLRERTASALSKMEQSLRKMEEKAEGRETPPSA